MAQPTYGSDLVYLQEWSMPDKPAREHVVGKTNRQQEIGVAFKQRNAKLNCSLHKTALAALAKSTTGQQYPHIVAMVAKHRLKRNCKVLVA